MIIVSESGKQAQVELLLHYHRSYNYARSRTRICIVYVNARAFLSTEKCRFERNDFPYGYKSLFMCDCLPRIVDPTFVKGVFSTIVEKSSKYTMIHPVHF